MSNSPTTNSLSRSPVRHNFILVAFAGAVFALAPIAMAVDPPPDGGYPGNNTAEGQDALFSLNVAGQDNTAIGFRALYSLQGKDQSTAVGSQALFSNVSGDWNTAVGFQALYHSTGAQNTAVGHLSLFHTTTGGLNTAIGVDSLYFNTTGNYNTAAGWRALDSNKTGNYNTATGFQALLGNHSGDNNTASGSLALSYNTNGNFNSAHGDHALYSNTTGSDNTGTGSSALEDNTTGGGNTAVGSAALASNTTGNSNVAIGDEAGTAVVTGNNIICIGANVPGGDVSDTIWIGNVYGVATVSGTTAPVVVSDTGQLGTVVSSERFKKDIAGMENASEAVLSLRPVTFHYKTDTKATPQFGLIAEEVAKVNPALVLPDKEGKPYTVRYDAVNAMLLNEFLKEHRKVAELEKQIATLTAGLQKVSAQLELNKHAPQTVLNNQ
jgi:hypothetical protein